MSLSNKLLAQMRAATRSLLRRGPAVARTVMRESIKTASSMHPAANQQAASNQASFDPASDMLADLSRIGQSVNPFNAPPLSTGAAAIGMPGHFIDGAFTNDAGTRAYKLYVPSSYTGQPSALLVMLHGCTQSPDDFALGTGMNLLAEEHNCLVLYPAQSQGANAHRCWNWFNAVDQKRGQGEPSIIAGMTRDLMARYVIDPQQVYVAGLSAGGAMSAILGTLYPELYAAVGVHSGLPFAAAHDLPTAMAAMKGDFRRPKGHKVRELPIIVFHGDQDTTVHPANGEEQVALEPGRVPGGHAWTRTVHRQPDGSIHAEHWLVHGFGHAWSGGDARGTYTDSKGPDASREMMRFFRTQR
jgi:poly(hydroxyalkanoate) depolymerase family esterase